MMLLVDELKKSLPFSSGFPLGQEWQAGGTVSREAGWGTGRPGGDLAGCWGHRSPGLLAGEKVFSVSAGVRVILGQFFQPRSSSGLSPLVGAGGLCAEHG